MAGLSFVYHSPSPLPARGSSSSQSLTLFSSTILYVDVVSLDLFIVNFLYVIGWRNFIDFIKMTKFCLRG
jgi:hypothetical protein